MSLTSRLTSLRSRLTKLFDVILVALSAPYSNRQLPALARRTRHRPGQASQKRNR